MFRKILHIFLITTAVSLTTRVKTNVADLSFASSHLTTNDASASFLSTTKTTQKVDDPSESSSPNPLVKVPAPELSSDQEAELMVDRTDPCNDHANCGRCSEDSRCGWCAANSQCMIGGTASPKLGVCASWTKGYCEVSKCGDYSHCMSCLADPYCGWCSAPSDDPLAPVPGKCMEGGSSGPGEAEGSCPDQWRHSPVRKGTSYTLASHLAATHGPYLREVCESSDGRIPYAPAPPARPLPKAKDPVLLTMFPRDGPLFGGTHVTITGLFFGYTKSDQTIYIGGHPCRETIWKSQSVMVCVTARAHLEQPGTFDVAVVYDGRRSDTTQNPDQKHMATFEYRELEIDAIHPKIGKTEGGTIVSIVGKNFGRKNFDPKVLIAGVPCVVVQWESPELIKCATPPGFGTNHTLHLEIEGIVPVTPRVSFSYASPVVSGLSPRISPTMGNITMIVTGSNFGTRHAMGIVLVNGVPCISQEWISHSRIDCVTPPGLGKGHVVRVKVDQRTSKNDEWMIDYFAPVVASIAPAQGDTPGGYAVLISGNDFGTGAYEAELEYTAMQWQYDVIKYGSPQAFGPSDVDENIVDEMLSSNMTLANTSNATKITANTKTSDLVRTALPASAMKDAGVRGNIQKAAMKAAMGDGAEGLAALAQATMMAARNDTTGVGAQVAAIAAATVETMNGITKGRVQGEDPDEAAEKVMKKMESQAKPDVVASGGMKSDNGHCPTGFVAITTATECETMAASLKLTYKQFYTTNSDGTKGPRPQGCYWNEDEVPNLVFNGGIFDSNMADDGQRYSICKPAAVTTGATNLFLEIEAEDPKPVGFDIGMFLVRRACKPGETFSSLNFDLSELVFTPPLEPEMIKSSWYWETYTPPNSGTIEKLLDGDTSTSIGEFHHDRSKCLTNFKDGGFLRDNSATPEFANVRFKTEQHFDSIKVCLKDGKTWNNAELRVEVDSPGSIRYYAESYPYTKIEPYTEFPDDLQCVTLTSPTSAVGNAQCSSVEDVGGFCDGTGLRPPPPLPEPKFEKTANRLCEGKWKKDFKSDDIDNTRMELEECQAKCADNPDCKGITYGNGESGYHKKCVICTDDSLGGGQGTWDFYKLGSGPTKKQLKLNKEGFKCSGATCNKAKDQITCCNPPAKCDSITDPDAFCDDGNGVKQLVTFGAPNTNNYCEATWGKDMARPFQREIWKKDYTLEECQALCTKEEFAECKGVSYGKGEYANKCMLCSGGPKGQADQPQFDYYLKQEPSPEQMAASFCSGLTCSKDKDQDKCCVPNAPCSTVQDSDSFCDGVGYGNGLIPGATCSNGPTCKKEEDMALCCVPNAKCGTVQDVDAFCDGNGLVADATCASGTCIKNVDQNTCCRPKLPCSNITDPETFCDGNSLIVGAMCSNDRCIKTKDEANCCTPSAKCSTIKHGKEFCSPGGRWLGGNGTCEGENCDMQLDQVNCCDMPPPPVVPPSPCKSDEAIDYTPRGPKCVRVLINGVSCLELTIVSSQVLRCLMPEGIGQNLSVAVIAGNQTSLSVVGKERMNRLSVPEIPSSMVIAEFDQWRYTPPTVTFMYPDVGPSKGGFVMTLKGRNFGTRHWGEGTVLVTIAGQPCMTTTWLSDNIIECMVPKGVGARHPVQVIVGGQVYPPPGSTELLLFSYNAPIVLDVSPKNGPTDGGFPLIITGRNFGRMAHHPQPYIGGVACTETTWISDSVIKCIAPEGHGKDKNVVVWVGEQHSDVENNYFKYDTPIVEKVTPDHCRTIGGCQIKVEGHNFGHEQGAHIAVYVDGHLCSGIGRGDQPQWLGHHALECVVGHGTGEDLDVAVEVSDQRSPRNDLFHYNFAQVFAVRPNHGSTDGGQNVTILGENFGTPEAMQLKLLHANDPALTSPSQLITVSMGGVPCQSSTWVSDTELKCVTGSGSGGDLIPRISVSNEFNTDASIFDVKKQSDMFAESLLAKVEAKKRKADGDLKFARIYKARSKSLNKEAKSMLVRSRGSMWLFDPPEIHGMNVDHGPAMGGTRLELTGINFAPDSRVVFGKTSASNKERAPQGPDSSKDPVWDITPCQKTTVQSSTSLICIAPAGMGDSHEIFVETGGRRYAQRNVSAITNIPKCKPPPPIQDGTLVASFEYLGSVVAYVCKENYTMVGDATLACEAPGLWVPETAPSCKPPPKPIPTILYPENNTNSSSNSSILEDVEPEEMVVKTEMELLTDTKKETEAQVAVVKDKEAEVREVAEEHFKGDQRAVKKQQDETNRVIGLNEAAKQALQDKLDESALKEAEEDQKRKDADAAVVQKLNDERKAEEAKKKAEQDALMAKMYGGRGGGGGGQASGTPGTGMLRETPTAEEQQAAIAKAEKAESIEKILADVAGLVEHRELNKQNVVDAEKKTAALSAELNELEKKISAAASDPALKTSLVAQRDGVVSDAEEAKRVLTAAKLKEEENKKKLQESMDDPRVKEARVAESQLKYDDSLVLKAQVKTSSKSTGQMLGTIQKELDNSTLADGGGAPGSKTVALREELKNMQFTFAQSKQDLARVTQSSQRLGESLAKTKDKVDTGTLEDLVHEVQEGSSNSETQGVGTALDALAKQHLMATIGNNMKLDDATKKVTLEALQNVPDIAQASAIANAALSSASSTEGGSAALDAVREAMTTAVPATTVYTQSDLVTEYLMHHPGFPGRQMWEIFAVRAVGGAGLMSAGSAHGACTSFPNGMLVTRDIAHAGLMSGFQRCQPAWIERYGDDQPNPDINNGKCATAVDGDTGKCPAGTEEVSVDDVVTCLHECPKASAVVMAGDAGCPTDQAPPCPSEGSLEVNGNCMTMPGTVVQAPTVVLAQALCTRPKHMGEAHMGEAHMGDGYGAMMMGDDTRPPDGADSLFLEVEADEADDADEATVPALVVYNISTGVEVNRYYDLTSEKGRSQDPLTNYILKGGMLIEPTYVYDTPLIYTITPTHGPAQGGTTLKVKGLNFGPNDAYTGMKLTFQINEIDGQDGKDWVDCRTTTWSSDSAATCVTPAGVGTVRTLRGKLQTLVGEASTIGLTYDRPILTSVEPSSGNTRGGYSVVVHGSNFGTVASTWENLVRDPDGKANAKTSLITIDGRECLSTSWISDTQVRCTVPPGWSKDRDVRMAGVAEQSSDPTMLFSYQRPEVHAIDPATAPTLMETPVVATIHGNNFGTCGGEENSTLPMGSVKGPKYCPAPTAFINGYPCVKTEHVSNNELKCTLPNGVGTQLRVNVVLGNLDAATNGFFTYAAPVLLTNEPKHGPAVGLTHVLVTGNHFGDKATASTCTAVAQHSCHTGTCCQDTPAPSLLLNDIVCQSTTWISNTALDCVVNPEPGVGARNPVTVVVGNQTTKTLNEQVRYTIDPPTCTATVAQDGTQVVPRGGGNYALSRDKNDKHVWEVASETVAIRGLNYGTTPSPVHAGYDETPCSTATWVSNTEITCVLGSPLRDGFEDRTPWVVVGAQESYSQTHSPGQQLEYQIVIYKHYPDFGLSEDGAPHLFMKPGLNAVQCQQACDDYNNNTDGGGVCKAVSRSMGPAGTCVGWSEPSLAECGKRKKTELYIHETVLTTSMGTCHARDVLRLGPSVDSVSLDKGANPDGGDIVEFTGFNFGLPGSPKAATAVGFIDEVPCVSTVVKSDTLLECTTPPNGNSGGDIVVRETFDTFTTRSFKARVKPTPNPLYTDVGGSTGGVSTTCGSTSMPGGSWLMPATGNKVLALNTMPLRFGGRVEFAAKVGEAGNCGSFHGNTHKLKGIALEVQYTTDTATGAHWQKLQSWSMDGGSPSLTDNQWHRLAAAVPAPTNTGTVGLRFVQTGGSPNANFYWAIDDVRVINPGGAVTVRVMVDGAKSVRPPTGKDSDGRRAPNAILTAYASEELDNAAVVVSGITTTDADRGLGGWSGYGTRHKQCSRNFKQMPKGTSLEACAMHCANQQGGQECTMFSWGSPNGKVCRDNGKDCHPHPIECRTALTPDGCSPTGAGTNGNALEIPANVPTVYERSTGRGTAAAAAHGALTSRATSVRVYPAAGGVFVPAGGYKERYERFRRPSTAELTLETSNDLAVNVGATVTVRLSTPFLVKKIQARQSPTFHSEGCAAKNVQITYPDGTSSLLTFPDNSNRTVDVEVMPDPGGPLGGELVSAPIKVKIAEKWTLPVVDSYELQVMATQGECPAGGQTTLRSVEIKGDVLLNLALPGSGMKECDVVDPTGLGYYKGNKEVFGCLRAHDGGSDSTPGQLPKDKGHAWITDGLGEGASITTIFDAPKHVYAVAVNQNEYHQVKSVKFTFFGGVGKDMNKEEVLVLTKQIPKDTGIVNVGGADGVVASSATMEILSTYDKYPIPNLADKGWRLYDDFKTEEFNAKVWSWPAAGLRGSQAVRFGYDAAKGATPLYFEGVATMKTPVRSIKRFPISHTEISVVLERTHHCSNHFVVLSPSENYKFSTGPEDNTVKFMYNCETKYLYGPKEKKAIVEKDGAANKLEYKLNDLETPCAFASNSGSETWNIVVEEEEVTFGGSKCGPPMVMKLDKGWNPSGQFFLYIGANQDVPTEKSYFGKVEVSSWGSGVRDLAYLGKEDEEEEGASKR